jgi:hypothetical protein
MVNAGQEEFSYDSFKMAYDADPVIQALVKNFSKNGIELATKNTKSTPSTEVKGDKTVSQMAKRATSAAMK